MKRIARIVLTVLAATVPVSAFAQNAVLQGGPFQPGHAPMYTQGGSQQPIVQDSGPAGGGDTGLGLSELLLTARGSGAPPYVAQGSGPFGTNFCNYDAPITNPTGYHFLCFSANAQGGALIASGSGGGAADIPLQFSINGVLVPFTGGGGSASLITGVTPITGGTSGYFLYNNGGVLGNLNPFITANTWTQPQAFSGGATVPTRPAGDSTTNAASTAFVTSAVAPGALNIVTSNYTINASDCRLTIQAGTGSTGFFTVTLPDVAGFPSPCSVTIRNSDITRGKTVAINGYAPFILWPLQSVEINSNSASWQWQPPGRWVDPTGLPSIQVNHASGNDSNDCLGTGAGACATIQGALAVVNNALDCANSSVVIQVAAETFTENAIARPHCPGSFFLTIRGSPSSPSSTVWQTTGVGLLSFDTGFVLVDGFKLVGLSNGLVGLEAGKVGFLGFQNIDFGTFPGGTHVACDEGGTINFEVGSYTISGSASQHVFMNACYATIAGATINIPSPQAFSVFLYANDGPSHFVLNGSSFIGSGAGSGSTGTKFVISQGAVALLNGVTLPGDIAGTLGAGACLDGVCSSSASALVGVVPIANGGTAAATAVSALASLGAVPLAGGTMSGALVLSADPLVGLGAATKQYVDSFINGIQVKGSVAVATTANITLSGEQTIDGVLTSTSRVLVKNQSSPQNNGIYVSAAGAWARSSDLSTWSSAGTGAVGAFTLVTAGSTQANTGWTTQVALGGTLGTTPMPWAQFSSQVTYSAGSGLALTGTTFSLLHSATTLGLTTLTLGSTALDLEFSNNHVIQWKDSGGGDVNALYLDGSNRFQIGGGDNVAIAATQASSGTGTGALQIGGGIYAHQSFFQGGVNNSGPTIAINERTRSDSDSSFLIAAGTSAGDFAIKTNGNVGIGTTTPTGFGGRTLQLSTATFDSAFRITDAGIVNADWAILASTGNTTPLFRIYNATQAADRFVIDALGTVGIGGTTTPSTIETGQGIAIGGAGNVGTIFVNPYVDSNDTTSGLVVKLNDQPAASTYGGTGYEYAIIGTIKSTHNDGSLQPNKVGVAGTGVASGATSGNVWGGYFECGLEAASSTNSFCIGTEIDVNNFSVDKGTDLAHPAYGLQITGASTFRSTAALLIAGTTSQWANGILFVNMRSGITDYGIDLAIDASNTFGQAAIRLPNNQTIAAKRFGGANLNILYLDSSDITQLGGGLPVAVASTLNVVGGYAANGVSGVSCSGAPTGSYAVSNGIVIHC